MPADAAIDGECAVGVSGRAKLQHSLRTRAFVTAHGVPKYVETT